MKNKKVKSFVTSVCKNCGNVARGKIASVQVPVYRSLFGFKFTQTLPALIDCSDEHSPCKVCGKEAWRVCKLYER